MIISGKKEWLYSGFLVLISFFLILFPPVEPRTQNPQSAYREVDHLRAPTPEIYEDNITFLLPEDLQLFYQVNNSEWTIYEDGICVSEFTGSYPAYFRIPVSYRAKPPVAGLPSGALLTYFVADRDGERSGIKNILWSSVNHEIPIVYLKVNTEDLFDFNSGIYSEGLSACLINDLSFRNPWWNRPANYKNKGEKWERRGEFYFQKSGQIVFSSESNYKIHGNASRAYPHKSFRIEFENDSEKASFFGKKNERVHSIVLRNSGNDWDRTHFSDAFIHTAAESLDVEIQEAQPVVLYINGVYWGIYNLRGHHNEKNISLKYGVKKKDVILLTQGEKDEKFVQEENEFDDLIRFCKEKDLMLEQNYNYVYDRIDIASFIDYLCIQVFFANTDWPNNNVRYFRLREYPDSKMMKWKFVLWDMDYAGSYTGIKAYNKNMFDHIRSSKGIIPVLFNNLIKNEKFKSSFIHRFNTILKKEFSSFSLFKTWNWFKRHYETEMKNHIDRWRYPPGMKDWYAHLSNMEEFIGKRSPICIQQLRDLENEKHSEK